MDELPGSIVRPIRGGSDKVVTFQSGSEDDESSDEPDDFGVKEGAPPRPALGSFGRGSSVNRTTPLLGSSGSGGYPSSAPTPSSSSRWPKRAQRSKRVVAPSDDEDAEQPPAAIGHARRLPGEPPPPPQSRTAPVGPPPPIPPSRSLPSSLRSGPPPLRGPPRPPPRARAAFEEHDEPSPARTPARHAGSEQAVTTASGRAPPPRAVVVGGAGETREGYKAPAFIPPPPPPPPRGSSSLATPPASLPAAGPDDGFWGRLAQGARSALGLVSDIVTSINYETDSEQENESKEGKSDAAASSATSASTAAASNATAPAERQSSSLAPPLPEVAPARSGPPEADDTPQPAPHASSPAALDESDDHFVEYVTQFCVYLGVDVAAEPHLIQEVAAYLKKPLPEGWTMLQTPEDCEFGAGFTYYMHAASARTQWTRPDEEEFLRSLPEKMKQRPLAGSRLFFVTLREHTRKARQAILEEQVGHLPNVRPLLRAMPDSGSIDDSLQQSLAPGGVVHVALHDHFPILHAAAVEAFSAYFGLGSFIRFGTAELRQVWIMKVAALCPVPDGWEFRFDEATMAAVFVDSVAGTASRRHPLDAFFAGLLERTMLRHRSCEAMETQRTGKPITIGNQTAFFLDAVQGAPYWLRFDKSGPLKSYVSSAVPRQAPPTMGGLPQLATPFTPAGPLPSTPPSQPSAHGPPAPPVQAWQSKAPPPSPPQRAPPPLPPKQGFADRAAAAVAATPPQLVVPNLPDSSCSLAPEASDLRLAARAGEPQRWAVPRSANDGEEDDEDEDEDKDESSSCDDNDSLVSFSTMNTVTVTTGRTELSARRQGEAEMAAVEAAAAAQASTAMPATPVAVAPAVAESAAPAVACSSVEPAASAAAAVPASTAAAAASTADAGSEIVESPAALEAPAASAASVAPTASAALEDLGSAHPPAVHEPPVAPAAPAAPAVTSEPEDPSAAPEPRTALAATADASAPAPFAPPEAPAAQAFGQGRPVGSRSTSPAARPPSSLPALPVLPSRDPVGSTAGSHWAVQNGKWQQVPATRKEDKCDAFDAGAASSSAPPPLRGAPPRRRRTPSPAGHVSTGSAAGASSGADDGGQQVAVLSALADRLRATPHEDIGAIVTVLEALEAIPVTVHQLRTTQLGVLTQAFKDHPDKRLRTVARRLRRSWKDVVQAANLAADEGDAEGPTAADAEAPPAAAASLVTDAGHGMAPTLPKLEGGSNVPKAMGTPLLGGAAARGPAGKATSSAGKRQRAELTANLQWLCRLFLETREQLFALHEGEPTEGLVCGGLREELDVVRFKHLLEEALMCPPGRRPPRPLVRMLRAMARRALHGRRCQEYGRRLHERFVAACSGHSDSRGFVTSAVPRVLQLITRVIEDDRRGADEGAADEPSEATDSQADTLWVDSSPEEEAQAEALWREESGGRSESTQEADSPLAGAAGTALHMRDTGEEREDLGGTATSGPKAAVGPVAAVRAPQLVPAQPLPRASRRDDAMDDPNASDKLASAAPRRIPAVPPYVSGEPALLAKVAKAPLSNLDGLVDCLVPGADLTSEGLLHQFADDELVAMAYVLEQIAEAASKRLVKELEVRDELRSTCLHRREYLQLIDSLHS